jgi:fucose permease
VSARRSIGVFVLALAITGWNCGNVGPVVSSLSREFDLSLSQVGLLSGTFFFGGSAIGSLAGAVLARRVRVLAGIWACCVPSGLRQ